MKEVKTTRLLRDVYRKYVREALNIRNSILFGIEKNVQMVFDAEEEGAFTGLGGRSGTKLTITIGGGLVSKIAKLPDSFTDIETFKPYLNPIVYAMWGLGYHEDGHVLFTDMSDQSIANYPEEKYRNFLHSLFNILEDPVIEICMANLFDKDTFLSKKINPRKFFAFIINRMFIPKCEEYEDDGTQNGFMNYLLLLVRCGKSKIKNKCPIYDKYQENLMPLIKAVLYESNPTERIHKTIKLGEWIIENIKEFNWEMPEIIEDPIGPGGPGEPISGKFRPGTEPEKPKKSPGIPPKAMPIDEPEGPAPGTPEFENEEEVEDEIKDVFNDVIHDGDDHEWIIAKEVCEANNPEVLENVEKQIEEFDSCIKDVSKFLNLFKGRIAPRLTSGFTSGKLNIVRAMRDEIRGGCDTKLFDRKIPRGKDKDLAVSLLCDNSGSMGGRKSTICSRAALALGQACDWSGIPFECNAFSKTCDSYLGTCLTIVEKSFEDSFESSKPYFAINDYKLIEKLTWLEHVRTFAGNSEEVNLYYIWKKFERVDHKTKLMFVLCDGLTTGSAKDLKEVVRQMEDSGIIVIGIGLCARAVEDIYPHHKIFNTVEEIESGLAQYLIDTISEYAI